MDTIATAPEFRVHRLLPLWGGAAALYASLFLNALPPFLRYAMAVAGFLSFLFGLRDVSLRWVLYLLIASVALEISSSLGRLPVLSPIDYYCVALFFTLALRLPARDTFKSIQLHFGKMGWILWGVFLLYGVGNALLQNGNPRIVLRWGEFLFIFYMASLAIAEAPEKIRADSTHLLARIGCLVALLGIVQFILSNGRYMSVVGTFHQHNILAAFLSFCFFASASFLVGSAKPRLLDVFQTIFIAIGLLLSFSRGAWLGIFVACGLVYVLIPRPFQHRLRPLLMAVVLVMGLGVGTLALFNRARPLADASARQLYWQAAGAVLKHHPLVGLGPGNYEKGIRDYLSGLGSVVYDVDLREKHRVDFWQHLHNLYLQLLVDYGLIGFALWIAALGTLLLPRIQTTLQSRASLPTWLLGGGVVAFLTHNLVDIITVNSLDLLFAIMLVFLGPPER